MKIKYLLTALLALAFGAISCSDDEYEISSLDEISLDKTYISIPMNGGSVDVAVKASTSWKFDSIIKVGTDAEKNPVYAETPKWLTISALSGAEGEYSLKFTADATEAGRETALVILAGDKMQHIMVRQGELTPTEATCAEVNAAPDGKQFLVSGTITSIENTIYGNWYMTDGTAELYIYGTLDAKGATKNFASLGLEVGDKVTIKGAKGSYKGSPQMVDVMVVKKVKSLFKLVTSEVSLPKEAGSFDVKCVVKGDYDMKYDASWISFAGQKTLKDTTVLSFNVAANEGVAPREAAINFTAGDVSMATTVSQVGNLPDKVTISEALATDYAHVLGQISAICNQGYVLTDNSGSVLVYWKADFALANYAIGDSMDICGKRTTYNFGPQFDHPDMEVKVSGGKFSFPTPVVYDAAKVEAIKDELAAQSANAKSYNLKMEYAKITGTVSVSGNYCNLVLEGTTALQGSFYQLTAAQQEEVTALNGKNVEILGYVQSCSLSSGAPKYLNFIYNSIKEK